jgi:chemotaxis protein MotB
LTVSSQTQHAPAKTDHGTGHGADSHGAKNHGADAHGGKGHGADAHAADAHGGDAHGGGHGGAHGGHHKSHEHDHGPGTPPWLISFGDMMTLFLCFFIMLVTMAKTQDAGMMAKGLGPFVASLEMTGNDGAMRGSEVAVAINRYRTRFGLDPLSEEELLTGHESPKDASEIEKLVHSALRSSFVMPQPLVARFAETSADLSEDARHYLDMLADSLRPGQGQVLVLEGHADDGDDAYDTGLLALRRARAVSEYFIEEHGFVSVRVEPRSWPRESKKSSGSRAVDALLVQPVDVDPQ